MEQIIHDEKNGLDYQLVGDYYIPMLKTSRTPQIGRFGRMHYDYIRKHNNAFFSGLWLSGEINGYIEQIDRDAEEMFSRLVKQLAESEGITEQLKADDQIEWGCRMNNVRYRAEEIVINEVIFVWQPLMICGTEISHRLNSILTATKYQELLPIMARDRV